MWTINAPCTFIILLRHTSNLLSGVWTIHLKCAIPKGKAELLLLVTLGVFLKKRQTLFLNTLPSSCRNLYLLSTISVSPNQKGKCLICNCF